MSAEEFLGQLNQIALTQFFIMKVRKLNFMDQRDVFMGSVSDRYQDYH